MSSNGNGNVDKEEIGHFDALSSQWWEDDGELRTLHHLNPTRLAYIEARCGSLDGKRVVDVGCGGGILAEAMALQGARVTGIDLADRAVQAARAHAALSGLHIDYQTTSAEALAAAQPGSFELVTCLELLEHVPDPAATIAACAALAAPGADLVFSTLNRTVHAYLGAVLGAEYLLRLLPRGTHDYQRFIRPSELEQAARGCALVLTDISGLSYNPFSQTARLTTDPSINYLAHFQRPAGD